MRTIIHVDMNAYFASVEQLCDPALKGKPVIVCGEGRTIVVTASYEARKYGIKTGMTLPEAKRLCPGLVAVNGNLDKYVYTSLRTHEIFLEFSDQVEVFSIDECYLDITHFSKPGWDPKGVAVEIKQRLKKDTGLTCSIGIGPNKVVAKVASKLQKPDGLVEIKEEEIASVYYKLPVEKLQGVGVGDKVAEKLKTLGIRTAGELGESSIIMLNAHFGVIGFYLKNIGSGKDDAPVKKYWEKEQLKSVGHSHTLACDTWDLKIARSYLRMLSEKVGVRLREANLMGKTVSLIVRYSDFNTFGKQHSLKHYIRSGYDIYFHSNKILEGLLPLKKAIRLLGVSISNLVTDCWGGFMLESIEKNQNFLKVVDSINRKYGDFTVKPSSLLIAEEFGIKNRYGMIQFHDRLMENRKKLKT